MVCPKCGYERNRDDDAFVSKLECPKCGIVYSKYQVDQAREKTIEVAVDVPSDETEAAEINECARCGFKIPKLYRLCIDCATAIDAESRQQREAVEEQKPVQKTEKEKASAWAVVIVLCMVFYFAASWGRSEDPGTVERKDWKKEDASIMAYIMIEDFVKGRLKAPGSANFPGFSEGRDQHVQRLEGQRYRIISWVDAQNGFGANIRNHFIGEIEQTSKDYWKLNSLEFSRD